MRAPRLGWDLDFHIGIRIADSAVNKSILILGMPGAGKSYAQQHLERCIADEGGCVVATSMNDTHTDLEGPNVVKIDVRRSGFPISFLHTVRDAYQREATEADYVQGLLKMFMGVHVLGSRQKRILRKAITMLVRTYSEGTQELSELARILALLGKCEKSMSDAAEAVSDIFYELLNGVKICPREFVVPGKIVVFDLSGYDELTQKVLTEITVSALWNKARAKSFCADKAVYLSLDEFQDLDCKPGGMMEEIIRQGRKYNLNLILTTQTLSTFESDMKAILQLPATRLYFKLSEQDLRSLCSSDLVQDECRDELRDILIGLQKGFCIADGKFSVGDVEFDGPLLMNFWNTESQQYEEE